VVGYFWLELMTCVTGSEFLDEHFIVRWELHSGVCNVVEAGHCGVSFRGSSGDPGYNLRQDFVGVV